MATGKDRTLGEEVRQKRRKKRQNLRQISQKISAIDPQIGSSPTHLSRVENGLLPSSGLVKALEQVLDQDFQQAFLRAKIAAVDTNGTPIEKLEFWAGLDERAEKQLETLVEESRNDGVSWTAIAQAIGSTPKSARQRYSKKISQT